MNMKSIVLRKTIVGL